MAPNNLSVSNPTSTPTGPNLYFAYGSNLHLGQMAARCPTSTYYGFGILRNYRWIICQRGFANVIATTSDPSTEFRYEGQITEDRVEGMLYILSPEDEKRLDSAENVPFAYNKFWLDVEMHDGDRHGGERRIVKALVYVDLTRIEDGACREEYIARINLGVRDARTKGMSDEYVEKVIRQYVPDQEIPDESAVKDPFLRDATHT